MKSLWVDDIRNPIAGFPGDIARSYDEAIRLLSTNDYQIIFLDHDLGDYSGEEGRERTGYDIVWWLAERKAAGFSVPAEYEFLTANPVGRKNMQAVIERYLL